MKKNNLTTIFCSLILLLIFSCKKDAKCTCSYTEEDYSTNVTTRDTFTKKISERKSAQKEACESANFAGTNPDRNLNYETKCWLD